MQNTATFHGKDFFISKKRRILKDAFHICNNLVAYMTLTCRDFSQRPFPQEKNNGGRMKGQLAK